MYLWLYKNIIDPLTNVTTPKWDPSVFISDPFLLFFEDERSRFLRNVGPYLQKGRNPNTLRLENLKSHKSEL
jgi:hypothetical protein